MKPLRLAALLSGLLLAGCTDADWDHAMKFTGVGDGQAAQAEPAPGARTAQAQVQTPAPQLDTGFCQQVAKQDASGNDFDAATQARLFQHNFQQCVALFGSGDPAVADAQ
jgi:hypothetical protein